MIPSPADLNYFLTIASLGNLSRAAESLGISQPSLTLAVKRLESSIGAEILVRHKRGVTLTPAGKQLLVHARQLMQHWDVVKADTLASVNEIRGSYSLGCHPSMALNFLPHFLPALLEENPQLEVRLHHDISRRITEQVINLGVDIGIAANPLKHPELIIKKLANDVVTLWHSAKYEPTFSSGNATLFCDPELTQTQVILKGMKKLGLTYSRLVPTHNLELIASLTAAGQGIGILPARVAKAQNLVQIPKSPVFYDEICLLYRGENRDIKAVRVITEAIKRVFINPT